MHYECSSIHGSGSCGRVWGYIIKCCTCSEIMHFDDRGTQENQTQRQHLSIFLIKDIIQWLRYIFIQLKNTRPPDLCGREFTGQTLKSLALGRPTCSLRTSGYFEPCHIMKSSKGIPSPIVWNPYYRLYLIIWIDLCNQSIWLVYKEWVSQTLHVKVCSSNQWPNDKTFEIQ